MAYDVFLSKRIQISLYDHAADSGRLYSGTFAAAFTCYEPFGKLLRNAYTNAPDAAELAETGILPESMTPPAPGVDSKSFLLYNPGTEAAHTIIRLAGDVGDGLLIRNFATGQRCGIINLTENSLLPGAHLELDSRMGQTRIVLGGEATLAFPFHDEGYITLAPCALFVRSMRIEHVKGANIVKSNGAFQRYMKGQYIYLDGGWVKLSQASNPNAAVIARAAESTGTTETPVVTMNEIEISGEGAQLTKLEVAYTPRVR